MCSTNDSKNGSGAQTSIDNYIAESKANDSSKLNPPKYVPSLKHEQGRWGSPNPIKTQEEGQHLLDTGYKDGKEIYNVTDSGEVVKFMPDNSPDNGYHSYGVSGPRDIPPKILKQFEEDNKLTKPEINKLRKGKKKKK